MYIVVGMSQRYPIRSGEWGSYRIRQQDPISTISYIIYVYLR